MTRKIHLAMYCAVALAGCAGEPFRVLPEREEPTTPTTTLPERHSVDPSKLVNVPRRERVFARQGASEVATVDLASRRVLSTTVVGDVVLDMARSADRLFVATSTSDLETSSVRVLRLTDAGLELEHESEPLGPGARLFPFPPFTLVFTEDMAVIWTLLDPELTPVGLGKALVRPASLALSQRHGESRLLALSTAAADFDELVHAQWAGKWELAFDGVPAPGRPSSRLATSSTRETAYLVRKDPDASEVELAVLDSAKPAFRSVTVPGAVGLIEAALVDPVRETLVLLLSRGSSTGALALVPLLEGVAPSSTPLSAPVESTEWFSRALVLAAPGHVLAATTQGVEVFELSGTAEAPALSPLPSFELTGMAGPLVPCD